MFNTVMDTILMFGSMLVVTGIFTLLINLLIPDDKETEV